MTRLFILFLISCSLSGCVSSEYNLATQQEETYFTSDEKEVATGLKLSRQVEKKFVMVRDDRMLDRLNAIGNRLVQVSDRKSIVYHFGIVDDIRTQEKESHGKDKEKIRGEINAFALPGGFIYVNKTLFDMATDDELACVVAHEIGHIAARHAVKRLQTAMGYTIFQVLGTLAADEKGYAADANTALSILFLAYSREDEQEADKLAVKYAKKAGYNPAAMLTFFDKLRAYEKDEIRAYRPHPYTRSHPYIDDRKRVIKQEALGHIDFEDYMNKTKEETF